MRIALYSNPPWSKSGYGVQTNLFSSRLAKLGHDVCVIANCCHFGSKINWNGVEVYPASGNPQMSDLILHQLDEFKPDIVLALYDAWSLDMKKFGNYRVVPWFMPDREPIPDAVLNPVKNAFAAIACSQFGKDACDELDIDVEYVPLTVNTNIFKPRDKAKSKKCMGIPEDKFLIGLIGDNKGWPTRKAICEQILAFTEFHKENQNSMLYLHTTASSARGGLDLRKLVTHLEMQEHIVFCNQSQYEMGFSDEEMVIAYNAFDVLTNVSMEEGFGVPIIEAQACGTPVIVGGWTSMPELVMPDSCSLIMEKGFGAQKTWNPIGSFYFQPITSAVSSAYLAFCASSKGAPRSKMHEWIAERYDTDAVIEKHLVPVLEKLQAKIERDDSEQFTKLDGDVRSFKSALDVATKPHPFGDSVLEASLELGCGTSPLPNVGTHNDKEKHSDFVDIPADLNSLKEWQNIPGNTYDTVFALDVLEHLSLDLHSIMHELHRIVREDGVVYIRVPLSTSWHAFADPTHLKPFHHITFSYFDQNHHLFEQYGKLYMTDRDSTSYWEVLECTERKADSPPFGELIDLCFVLKRQAPKEA